MMATGAIMTAEELRDRILEVLIEELGTYTIAGNVVPAIAILSTGQSLPSDRTVSGLEIIIRREPDRKPVSTYSGAAAEQIFTVFFSQWEGNYTIGTALDKLDEAGFMNTVRIVPIDEQKGIKEQFLVKIREI